MVASLSTRCKTDFKEAEDGEELVAEGLARVVEDILQLRASIRATLL